MRTWEIVWFCLIVSGVATLVKSYENVIRESSDYVILSEQCGRAIDANNRRQVYLNPFVYRPSQIFKFQVVTGGGNEEDTEYLIVEKPSNASLNVNRKGLLRLSETNRLIDESGKWNLKRLRFENQVLIRVKINQRVSCLRRSRGRSLRIAKCESKDVNQRWILVPLCNNQGQSPTTTTNVVPVV